MFKLMRNLQDREAKARRESLAHYRVILLAGDSATTKQINELQELMDKLGFDSAKVAADAEAMASRSKLIDTVNKVPARKAAMDKAREEHAAWCDEAERTFREVEAKTSVLLQKKHAAETEFGASMNARRRLIELSRANMELFDSDEGEIRRLECLEVGIAVDPIPLPTEDSQ